MTQTNKKTVSTESNEKYTELQTNELLTSWREFKKEVPDWEVENRDKADEKIKELAEKYQKGIRSIIGKLTRHGEYSAKSKVVKKGGGQNKAELSQAIGKVLNLAESEIESLENAGKTALTKIFQALAMSKPITVLTPQEIENHKKAVESLINIISLNSDSVQDLQNVKIETINDVIEGIDSLESDLIDQLSQLEKSNINLQPQN